MLVGSHFVSQIGKDIYYRSDISFITLGSALISWVVALEPIKEQNKFLWRFIAQQVFFSKRFIVWKI
jgi:hypothetical protein